MNRPDEKRISNKVAKRVVADALDRTFERSVADLEVELLTYESSTEPVYRGDEVIDKNEFFESAEVKVTGRLFYPRELEGKRGSLKRVMDKDFFHKYLGDHIYDEVQGELPSVHDVSYAIRVSKFKAKPDRRDPDYVNIEVTLDLPR